MHIVEPIRNTGNPPAAAHFRAVTFAGILLAILVTALPVRAESALAEAQQKADAGQYPEALKLIAGGLNQTKPTDETPERYQLLMLRADCLLHINQRASAMNVYDVAIRSAPDVKSAALARASMLLAKASPNNLFTPLNGEPLSTLDADSRKQAFDGLRDQLAKSVKPKYEAAMNGKSLTPMIKVLPSLLDLGYLEFAANGSAEKTRGDLQAMGKRARELINTEMKSISHRLNALEVASNTTSDYTRRGLFSNERNAVQSDIDELNEIAQVARDARKRANELGMDGSVWEPVIADSADLADRAQALLNVSN